MKRDFDLNIVDHRQMTPLNHCALTMDGYENENNELITNNKNFKCFELLAKEKGVNPNIKDEYGFSPFLRCIQKNKREFVNYFIQQSEMKDNSECDWKLNDITQETTHTGSNGLKIAATRSNYSMLELLLKDNNKLGWDLNFVGGRYKYTVLHDLAATRIGFNSENEFNCDNWQCIELLINMKNIDLDLKNPNGDDIVSLMKRYGKVNYVKYLIDNQYYIAKSSAPGEGNPGEGEGEGEI